MITHIDLVCHS